jgi:hypothetical protein
VWHRHDDEYAVAGAEPIGDETRYTSDLLVVQPGQVIELNVEGTITRSNYSIQ